MCQAIPEGPIPHYSILLCFYFKAERNWQVLDCLQTAWCLPVMFDGFEFKFWVKDVYRVSARKCTGAFPRVM